MKKLLTLLSAIILTSSATLPVQGMTFSKSYKSEENDHANYIADATSRALRGAILNDQEVLIRGNKIDGGIDYKYATGYYGNQKIKDVMSKYFDSNSVGPNEDDTVSAAYGSLFGTAQDSYQYTIMDSINRGDLTKNGISSRSKNLLNLVTNKSSDGTKPDDDTQGIISAVLSAGKVVFGNDFTPYLASMFVNILGGHDIAKELANKNTKAPFEKIDNVLNKYSNEISNAVASLTQENVPLKTKGKDKDGNDVENTTTIKDRLSVTTNELFEALIYFTATKKENDKTIHYVFDPSADAIKKYGDASTRFWNHLLNGNFDGLIEATGKETENIINQVSKVIDFLMTLMHYYRSLDRYTKTISISSDGSHLFDFNKTNGQIKKEVLDLPYFYDSDSKTTNNGPKDSNDYYWFIDGDTHYMKLNLQNLFSDLAYYLSPDNRGYQLMKSLNVLFGGVQNDKGQNDLNPIMDVILSPVLKIVKDKASSIISTVAKVLGFIPIPQIKDLAKNLSDLINNLPEYAAGILDWLVTDNSTEAGPVVSLISSIMSILSKVTAVNSPEKAEKLYKEVIKIYPLEKDERKIAKLAVSAIEYVSTYGDDFVKHPWTQLYRGNLLGKLSNLAYFKVDFDRATAEMGEGLANLKDLKNILTNMHIDKLVLNIGHVIGYRTNNKKDLVLSDWLYASKDYTIASLINKKILPIFETSGTSTLDENQNYYINSGVIKNLVDALVPHKLDDKKSIRISRQKVQVPNSINCNDKTTPVINYPNDGQAYDEANKSITLSTQNIADNSDLKNSVVITRDSKPISGISIASVKEEANKMTIQLSGAFVKEKEPYDVKIVYTDAKNNLSSETIIEIPDQDGNSSSETVSPIMALFYSLEYIDSNQAGLPDLTIDTNRYWKYTIQLPDDNKVYDLINANPETFADSKNTGNVNANALNYILGLKKGKDGNDSFASSSLFQALSRLYGHDYDGGNSYQAMTNGAQSIFSLASSFGDLTSDSIKEVVKDHYMNYLKENNWKIKNVSYDNLLPNSASPDVEQDVQYDMVYFNPFKDRTYTYHIKLIRFPYSKDDPTVGWRVVQLMRQN